MEELGMTLRRERDERRKPLCECANRGCAALLPLRRGRAEP
jgi:hypothetical protein